MRVWVLAVCDGGVILTPETRAYGTHDAARAAYAAMLADYLDTDPGTPLDELIADAAEAGAEDGWAVALLDLDVEGGA